MGLVLSALLEGVIMLGIVFRKIKRWCYLQQKKKKKKIVKQKQNKTKQLNKQTKRKEEKGFFKK